MRIISLNVNGILAAVEQGLFSWLQAQNADVICLQDTRATLSDFDEPSLQLDGYFVYACDAEQPSQGGVAIYSRQQPKAVITGLGFESADRYGRYLQADFDKLKQIAQASNAAAYDASNPATISKVFTAVLSNF